MLRSKMGAIRTDVANEMTDDIVANQNLLKTVRGGVKASTNSGQFLSLLPTGTSNHYNTLRTTAIQQIQNSNNNAAFMKKLPKILNIQNPY